MMIQIHSISISISISLSLSLSLSNIATGSCVFSNCKSACVFSPNSKGCSDCTSSHCYAALSTCTGIPVSNFPHAEEVLVTVGGCGDADKAALQQHASDFHVCYKYLFLL